MYVHIDIQIGTDRDMSVLFIIAIRVFWLWGYFWPHKWCTLSLTKGSRPLLETQQCPAQPSHQCLGPFDFVLGAVNRTVPIQDYRWILVLS